MDEVDDELRDHYLELLTRVHSGRSWVIAIDVLVAATGLVTQLRRVGADDLLVVAGTRGVGSMSEDVEVVLLGVEGDSMMDAIRAYDRALGDLGDAVQATVDRFDPDRVAGVIVTPFATRRTVADRPVHGAREPAWLALEDKTVVDAVWDAAGVPRVPSVVVAATESALVDAAAQLDAGDGTVWVADNRRGWHGGASGLRWVRSTDQARDAAAFMADEADQVRVMPFLEGIPCSIHGMVMPDTTITFRPCEMVTLRRPDRSDLQYAGMGTWWDPPVADRDAMRGAAHRVGEHLRRTVGYRGAFTIDGVMTSDGFRPTELNPRYGAALGLLASAVDLSLYLLHLAVVEQVDVEWRSAELERWVVAAADATPSSHGIVLVDEPQPERELRLRRDGDALVDADGDPGADADSDAADVVIATGPAPAGGAVRVAVSGPAGQRGRPVADTVAAALRFADTRWHLGIGAAEPARDVRR